MTDDELRRQVAAELSWDPQVDSEVIDVSAGSGTVTLHGTVDSLRQKRAGARPPHASAGHPGRQRTAGTDPGRRPARR
jgi:BON domain